jgi:hypothetical protein
MNDALAWHMLPFLNLVETIDLSRVSKELNDMVKQRVGLRASEIMRLRRILRSWKHIRRPRSSRNNSWRRLRHHPDERVIL